MSSAQFIVVCEGEKNCGTIEHWLNVSHIISVLEQEGLYKLSCSPVIDAKGNSQANHYVQIGSSGFDDLNVLLNFLHY